MGSIPKNAEKDDFLSKFPGMGSDLSASFKKCTYFDNFMSTSVDDQIGFYMSCFCVRLNQKLFWVNVKSNCFKIINDRFENSFVFLLFHS